MRLIDADTILKADENSDKALVLGSGKALEIAYALLKKKVADAPTVDAVVVTRCKDCRSYNKPKTGWCEVHLDREHPDDYCSYGKRKDGGDNGAAD